MGKKETTNKKEAKTVKVSTLAWTITGIIFVLVVASLSFKMGLDYKTNDQNRVTAEAAHLVQTLKSSH